MKCKQCQKRIMGPAWKMAVHVKKEHPKPVPPSVESSNPTEQPSPHSLRCAPSAMEYSAQQHISDLERSRNRLQEAAIDAIAAILRNIR